MSDPIYQPVEGVMELGFNYLWNLPTELLFHITSLLDVNSAMQLGSTCARLYAVTHDLFLWSSLTWKSTDKLNDMLNTMKFIKLYRNHMKSISLTCSAIPLRLSKDLPELLPCKLLQSLSLTNFKCTLPQVRKIWKLPVLSELHLLSYAFGCNLFEEVTFSKCKLKLLSICSNSFTFSTWARCGFAPPNLRVLLSRVYPPTQFNMVYNLNTGDIVNYFSTLSFPQ